MSHEDNTWGRKDIAVTTDSLKSQEDNIIIKRLQEDYAQLQAKCDCFEKRLEILQSSIDDQEQYD